MPTLTFTIRNEDDDSSHLEEFTLTREEANAFMRGEGFGFTPESGVAFGPDSAGRPAVHHARGLSVDEEDQVAPDA